MNQPASTRHWFPPSGTPNERPRVVAATPLLADDAADTGADRIGDAGHIADGPSHSSGDANHATTAAGYGTTDVPDREHA